MATVTVGLDARELAQETAPFRLSANGNEIEVFEIHSDLAPGSLRGCREKFSVAGQKQVVLDVINELDPEAPGEKLYKGDFRQGEIEITGIKRILVNRFWCEVEYNVLFPPKAPKTEPAAGTYRCIRWNVGIDCGAAVLCLTKFDEVVLVREFKHAARRWVLGIPRGLRRPDESLEDCALREANEESGVSTTETSKVFDLGYIDPDTGVLMTRPRILCVTDVVVDENLRNRDLSESAMGNLVLSLDSIRALIKTGELTDGFTLTALTLATVRGALSPGWLL